MRDVFLDFSLNVFLCTLAVGVIAFFDLPDSLDLMIFPAVGSALLVIALWLHFKRPRTKGEPLDDVE